MTLDRHLNRKYSNLMKALQDNEGAECEQVPEIFFPYGFDMQMYDLEIKSAKTICNRCPIKNDCLDYALEADEPFGIWGGTTPADRRQLKKYRR